MVCDISRQVDIGYPIRNELDGIGGDTQEEDNVRVRQVFPHDDHLVESLSICLAPKHEGKRHQIRTIPNVCGSPSGCIITRRIRTFEPPKVPLMRGSRN